MCAADAEPEEAEEKVSYQRLAEINLEAAVEAAPHRARSDEAHAHALVGVGYAVLASGEGAESFYGMFGRLFTGPEGRAVIDAWISGS